MPYLLSDLVIDRVDLVDEGANSAAFIELYKRKEQSAMDVKEILSKMKPEHSAVIEAALNQAEEDVRKAKEDLATAESERDEANTKLTAANEDLDKAKTELETLKASGNAAAFDETEVVKSMPEPVRELFEKMKSQKEAAEEEIRKAKEEKEHAEAVAKANEFKSIPFEHEKLVDIVKSASPELLELLKVANAAIETSVLGEVGKNRSEKHTGNAWEQIEAKADEIATRDNITKAKAVSVAISENPELYKQYLKEGAN